MTPCSLVGQYAIEVSKQHTTSIVTEEEEKNSRL
jgi:hypothetical protein